MHWETQTVIKTYGLVVLGVGRVVRRRLLGLGGDGDDNLLDGLDDLLDGFLGGGNLSKGRAVSAELESRNVDQKSARRRTKFSKKERAGRRTGFAGSSSDESDESSDESSLAGGGGGAATAFALLFLSFFATTTGAGAGSSSESDESESEVTSLLSGEGPFLVALPATGAGAAAALVVLDLLFLPDDAFSTLDSLVGLTALGVLLLPMVDVLWEVGGVGSGMKRTSGGAKSWTESPSVSSGHNPARRPLSVCVFKGPPEDFFQPSRLVGARVTYRRSSCTASAPPPPSLALTVRSGARRF